MDHEKLARRSAYILGDSSAAAMALAELDRRRAEGQEAQIFDYDRTWFVVSPAIEPPLPSVKARS